MKYKPTPTKRKIWTADRLKELKELCGLGLKKDLIANRMGLDPETVRNGMSYYGIKNGRGGLKKGHTEYKKRKHWPKTMKHAGSFKPGVSPAHTLPEGTIRECNKGGHIERQIKTGGKWVAYNKYLWKKYNGSIPDNHVVRIIDPSEEITIRNLELITMRENLLRNLNVEKRARTQSEQKRKSKELFKYREYQGEALFISITEY
jgi:hypothetical protein